jgi:uncharacterized membrane protein YhaH (DUF805 family)
MTGQWPDPADPGTPPAWGARLRRQQVLGRVLVVLVTVVGVLALATLVSRPIAGDDVSDTLAVITVAALVAAPIVRVTWLAVRWFRLGDTRFAWLSVVLLVIVGIAAVV